MTPFKKFDSYGSFVVEQDFEPANEYLDINSLGSVEDHAAYTLRMCRNPAAQAGREQADTDEVLYQANTTGLAELDDGLICPVEMCDTQLKP